jgi:small GTP-binding protein
MIQKKICLLGSFAVGKTSLISRFVRSIFSDKYLTTVGVKIDKKLLTLNQDSGNTDVNLMIWDLNGEDQFQKVQMSYVRGSSGYFLVIDGTRRESLDVALLLHERIRQEYGPLPFIVLLNKNDLKHTWTLRPDDLELLADLPVLETSAKSGENVEAAFARLAQLMLGPA